MRSLILTALTLALCGSAALAMPGATVGIPLGSPDPFGTMRRGGEPSEAVPPAAEQRAVERRIGRRPKSQTPRHRSPKALKSGR